MSEEKHKPHTWCEECKEDFGDSFSLIDHVTGEEEFDPYYLLPNEYKFLLGSFLRLVYDNAQDSEYVEQLVQSVYVTLFAAEYGYDGLDELVEDMVVTSATRDMDEELRKLIEEETKDDDKG